MISRIREWLLWRRRERFCRKHPRMRLCESVEELDRRIAEAKAKRK